MDKNGIIYVRLKNNAIDGQSEFFFSTLGAVYDKFNYRLLGVRQATLRQYLWQGGGRYENACCEVKRDTIYRKSK